jgi:hypothetical protein
VYTTRSKGAKGFQGAKHHQRKNNSQKKKKKEKKKKRKDGSGFFCISFLFICANTNVFALIQKRLYNERDKNKKRINADIEIWIMSYLDA